MSFLYSSIPCFPTMAKPHWKSSLCARRSWSIRVEIWLALSEGYIPVHSQSRALWTLVTLVPQSHPTID